MALAHSTDKAAKQSPHPGEHKDESNAQEILYFFSQRSTQADTDSNTSEKHGAVPIGDFMRSDGFSSGMCQRNLYEGHVMQ